MRLLLSTLLLAGSLQAQPVIEAHGDLASDVRDEHGDTVGGIGSGLVYEAKSGLYYSISDRGPGDGTLPYRPRCVVLKIPQVGDKLEPEIVRSILLRDEAGREMTGLIPDDAGADVPRMKDGRTCIDPEALALAPDGSLYITDEYGPYLYQFTAEGTMMRRMVLPDEFQPRTAEGKRDFTGEAKLVSGRNINQGPEGMCLLPDGRTAALIFQSGLMQDGGHSAPTTRILLLDLTTEKPVAMFEYPFTQEVEGMAAPVALEDLSVNDLASVGEGKFLVLERDRFGRDGSAQPRPAGCKAVWLVDTAGATNLLGAETSSIEPVKKTLLLNLPALWKDAATLAAKWESVTPLPDAPPGTLLLMMSADNDFLAPVIHHAGETYAFPRAVDPVPSQFFKIRVPLPKEEIVTR